MKKLFLTQFQPKGEEMIQRLVYLNLDHNHEYTENQQLEMAVEKVKIWFKHRFPKMELRAVMAYSAIGDSVELQEKDKSLPLLPTTTYYTSIEIPARDEKEEDLSDYVLIDINGNREQDDFEIGCYNFSTLKWSLKHSESEIDMVHMRWTELPLNKEPLAKG